MFVVERSGNKSLDKLVEADLDPTRKESTRLERKRAKREQRKKSARVHERRREGEGMIRRSRLYTNGGIRSTCILLPCLLQTGFERVSRDRFWRQWFSRQWEGERDEKRRKENLGRSRGVKVRIYRKAHPSRVSLSASKLYIMFHKQIKVKVISLFINYPICVKMMCLKKISD